jgi:hypothetical protein
MEPEAAYPAARIVSPQVHAYFTRQRAESRPDGEERVIASLPEISTIQAIVDAAFWASLRREEGFIPKISLAFVSPEQTQNALLLARPLPLDPGILTKVSPAVERPGIHLGVFHGPDGLRVWGATRSVPSLCMVVEVAAPGLLVIKHHSSETAGKFVNVAVLEGDQVKLVDERAVAIPDCPALLTALLGSESPAAWVSSGKHSVHMLVQLAVSMRAHGRGGSLLVVPAAGEIWRESIVSPIPYAVSPPFSGLAEVADAPPDRLNRIVEAVMLTYVALAVGNGGAMTDTAAVVNTWAQFSTGSGPANVRTWDGRIMSYYTAPFGACATNSANLVENLGPSGPSTSGQCGAFAFLLESALAVNGINSEWTTVGTLDGSAMVIKNWGLSSSPTYATTPPTGFPQFIYKLILNTGDSAVGMDPPPSGGFGDLTNDMGVPGQNEPSAPGPLNPVRPCYSLGKGVRSPLYRGDSYRALR